MLSNSAGADKSNNAGRKESPSPVTVAFRNRNLPVGSSSSFGPQSRIIQARPARILLTNSNSNNGFVGLRRYSVEAPNEVPLSSPSPPSSCGGGSPLSREIGSFTSAAAQLQQQSRSRSKMHELALKHRLITEQDGKSGLLVLSSEERRTLTQEGYAVPTRLPLSKTEEEALKIVRRKIKNKLSAQESRRKRRDYMNTLEHRVNGYYSENAALRQRVRQLEQNNRNLSSQLKQIQDQPLPGGRTRNHTVPTNTTSTQTASFCLMACLLLFAVCLPIFPIGLLPQAVSQPSFVLSRTFSEPAFTDFVKTSFNKEPQTPQSRLIEDADTAIGRQFQSTNEILECRKNADDEVAMEGVVNKANCDGNFATQPVQPILE